MRFRSVVNTSQQAIFALLTLHNNGQPIQLDPMFNVGSMYKGLSLMPQLRFDLNPQHETVRGADARDLPIQSSSIQSVMLDPPWLISDGDAHLTDQFYFVETKVELKKLILSIIHESYRVLVTNGLMIFKCQDFIHNRRKWFMSYYVMKCALETRFNPIDSIIVSAPSRPRSQKDADAQHASDSYHTFFIAFRKKQTRTAYDLL